MEQALIGAILQKNDILADIANIVSAVDFEDSRAAILFNLCLDRWKDGKQTDIVIAVGEMSGKIDPMWIVTATDSGSILHSTGYAEKVAEAAKLKRIKEGVLKASESAFDSNELISLISDISIKEAGRDDDVTSAEDCVSLFSEMRKSGGLIGKSSGYGFLDRKDIMAVPGDYWAIGAATSVGKSAFAINLFTKLLVDEDAKISIISTEMTKHQMMARIIGCLTDIPSGAIMKDKLRGQLDEEKVAKAEKYLASKVFFMSEKTRDIAEIENVVRGLDLKKGLDVVFVDYLQHCRSRNYKSQYDILSDVTGRLQNLSKQTDTTIIGLNQLSNAAAKDPEGNLEFKGAGDIAADCDIGIILRKNKSDKSMLLAEIKKNRHGALGRQALQYSKSFAMLEEVHHAENW